MKVLSWEELEPFGRSKGPLAAAVGVFDGLHRGHMKLIGEVLARQGLVKGVVTFRENPKKTLRPSSFHGDIFTLDQKLETLASLGLDACVLIDFSGDFSKLAGRKFLSLLRDRGDLRFLAVGADFKCGYRLDTGAEEIRAYYEGLGVETRLLQPLLWTDRPVSSSRIRKAIVDGRLDDARSMLGRDYELDFRGARVAASGASMLIEADGRQVQPPEGEYLGAISYGGEYLPASAAYRSGGWILPSPATAATGTTAPSALRLERLVSKEQGDREWR
jgi:riboflavin kinase/FMN adenylyltransferase